MKKHDAFFIAFEGIDGAGTTTQSRMLVDWLNENGQKAHLTCEPSGGPLGTLLRSILKQQTTLPSPEAIALLFAADRLDHTRHTIDPQRKAGVHVISDRSVYSSLAYQSIESPLEWVSEINRFAPEPDITYYLRVDPDEARARRIARGEEAELFDEDVFQNQVSDRYDQLLLQKRNVNRTPNTHILDASLSILTIHKQICDHVESLLA